MGNSRLFNIRCNNCSAEYRISSRGEMNCPFCGGKVYLNDKDFEEYKKVRDEMLLKDKEATDIANLDGDVLNRWNKEFIDTLETNKGVPVNISYFYKYEKDDSIIYVGRNNITIIKNGDFDKFISNVEKMKYPSADIKNLAQFLPQVNINIDLKDNKSLLSVYKPENAYPLAMFSDLDPRQVAWIISRLENLGCLLEFNSFELHISKEDIYVNPKTHQVYILGGWDKGFYLYGKNVGVPTTQYLRNMRSIIKSSMNLRNAPVECQDFLNRRPCNDAYSDFKEWDSVIKDGFGGHNFIHFSESVWN